MKRRCGIYYFHISVLLQSDHKSQLDPDFEGLAPDSARADLTDAPDDIGAKIRRGSIFDIDV
jgi:hypothetical protein